MTEIHSAVRDVYDQDPPLGTVEADIHMIARTGRLMDASMKQYARILDDGHGPFTDPDQVLDQAESYLQEAQRRFRRLRRLLAGRRLMVAEVHPGLVVALSSPADPHVRGAGITCKIRREELPLDYQLIEQAPERSGTETTDA